jgi:hypothetical protein
MDVRKFFVHPGLPPDPAAIFAGRGPKASAEALRRVALVAGTESGLAVVSARFSGAGRSMRLERCEWARQGHGGLAHRAALRR